jgi:hypothetical protein
MADASTGEAMSEQNPREACENCGTVLVYGDGTIHWTSDGVPLCGACMAGCFPSDMPDPSSSLAGADPRESQ